MTNRGGGMNGKGLWTNVCLALFGSYATMPGIETFTRPPPTSQTPAPNILALKGKRLLLVTETEERFQLQAAWMKTLRDQSSEIEARTLYKDPVKFSPSWLISMSTNVQLKWSTMDGGVLRSYCCIPWPISFGPVAKPAENIRKGNPDYKSMQYAKSMAPQFFFILRAVNRVFFRDCQKTTVVLPRPREVVVCTEEMTNTDVTGSLAEFIALPRVTLTADFADASTDSQVVRAYVEFTKGVVKKDAALTQILGQYVKATVNGRRLLKCKGASVQYVKVGAA